jgi:hypothetical protein
VRLPDNLQAPGATIGKIFRAADPLEAAHEMMLPEAAPVSG